MEGKAYAKNLTGPSVVRNKEEKRKIRRRKASGYIIKGRDGGGSLRLELMELGCRKEKPLDTVSSGARVGSTGRRNGERMVSGPNG